MVCATGESLESKPSPALQAGQKRGLSVPGLFSVPTAGALLLENSQAPGKFKERTLK